MPRPSLSFPVFEATKEPRAGATMSYRDRSFAASLGIVVVLIAVAALAAMLAP